MLENKRQISEWLTLPIIQIKLQKDPKINNINIQMLHYSSRQYTTEITESC